MNIAVEPAGAGPLVIHNSYGDVVSSRMVNLQENDLRTQVKTTTLTIVTLEGSSYMDSNYIYIVTLEGSSYMDSYGMLSCTHLDSPGCFDFGASTSLFNQGDPSASATQATRSRPSSMAMDGLGQQKGHHIQQNCVELQYTTQQKIYNLDL